MKTMGQTLDKKGKAEMRVGVICIFIKVSFATSSNFKLCYTGSVLVTIRKNMRRELHPSKKPNKKNKPTPSAVWIFVPAN